MPEEIGHDAIDYTEKKRKKNKKYARGGGAVTRGDQGATNETES